MLRHILRPIVRLTLWIFFRRIDVRGHDHIPLNRPMILVANHPNVMFDALILGACTPGITPYFLGKSTLFKRHLYAWFLRLLGVIPVARAQDRGARMSSNRDMLRLACQILQDGDSLALFPEGVSHAEARVRSLKPGAARIALRTEDESDGQTGVCIVPVGLTYSAPGIFRSDVSVHFGEAIEISPFLHTYCENRGNTEKNLTAHVQERLAALTRHIENPSLETVIRDLASIYTQRVAAEVPDSLHFSGRLRAEQEIIRAVHRFADTEPELVRSFAARLSAHHRKLKRLRIEPDALSRQTASLRAGHPLLALLLLPFALYGFVHNVLPYYLPRLFVRPYQDEPEMVGTIKIVAGIALFLLHYLVLTAAAYLLIDLYTAFLYAASLPLSGLVTLFYDEQILQRSPLWQRAFFSRKLRTHLERLSHERAAIIHDLDTIKKHYLAQHPSDP